MGKYTNPDDDINGPWMSDNLTGLASPSERPNLHYEVINPETGNKYPPHPSRGWIYGRERMNDLITDGRILWPKKLSGRPRLKRYAIDMLSERTGFSTMLDAPGNVEATKNLASILGPKAFAFSKPSDFVAQLIEQVTNPGDLVLDSFAGSGTTGHAVLKMNATKSGKPARHFILVEMDEKITTNITRERVKRVADGYTNAKGEAVPGLGGGFRYVRLGDKLFDEHGRINETTVRFADLARHVYFSETGEPLPKERISAKSPLLGIHHGRAVYLLYNGILGDKSVDGGNALCRGTLKVIQASNAGQSDIQQTIVYGTSQRLALVRLTCAGILFKQIPYSIRTQ